MSAVIIGVVIIGYAALLSVRFGRYATAARTGVITRPYTCLPTDSHQHVLILGDSTMYGAGIKDPAHTVGGLLAAKYPTASIETLAVNGARVSDLPGQLDRARYEQYELIIIGVGGNDIVRLSRYRDVSRELTALLQEVSKLSSQIILCHSVNIGNIGFFPFPLNYLFDYRSRQLSLVFKEVAAPFSAVSYVNFYRPMRHDHYNKQSRPKFIASDAFHPNDYANRYFFDLIWKAVDAPSRRSDR